MHNQTPRLPLGRRRFLATVGTLSATFAGFSRRPAAAAPITAGLRVFTCGHSFHVWVAPLLADLAEKAGIRNHSLAGVSSIGGSRVIQHWDVPDDKNTAKKALTAGQVDVLTVSPIWLPDAGIENFARLAIEHNPNIRITVQEFWLPNDTFNPVYPLETRKKVDHNAATIPELEKQNDLYRETIENHVREINERLKTSALAVVPVGEASIALREKILARQARPLKVQWSLFTDDWG
ncbi:MAG TPA: SGNH/GDSL hydrolase family protein, partial [Pirellulales bacterium]